MVDLLVINHRYIKQAYFDIRFLTCIYIKYSISIGFIPLPELSKTHVFNTQLNATNK